MASAAGSLALQDFVKDGIIANEGVKVELQDNGTLKMFVKDDAITNLRFAQPLCRDTTCIKELLIDQLQNQSE